MRARREIERQVAAGAAVEAVEEERVAGEVDEHARAEAGRQDEVRVRLERGGAGLRVRAQQDGGGGRGGVLLRAAVEADCDDAGAGEEAFPDLEPQLGRELGEEREGRGRGRGGVHGCGAVEKGVLKLGGGVCGLGCVEKGRGRPVTSSGAGVWAREADSQPYERTL